MQFIIFSRGGYRTVPYAVFQLILAIGLLSGYSVGQESERPPLADAVENAVSERDPKIQIEKTSVDEPAPKPAEFEKEVRPPLVTKDKPDLSRVSAQNGWYVRPDRKTRFNGYVKSMVGPVSLARYAATAGMTTYRNAPSEWGNKWEGFGRRFASNLATGVIQNSVQYGLDETLKLDSKFYKSRNRSISARMRNAVFSAVTARNPQGKRVFGAPKLVGRVVSKVVAAETWYPDRYDYVHGLKGAAISTAISAGVNLFREFVLNR